MNRAAFRTADDAGGHEIAVCAGMSYWKAARMAQFFPSKPLFLNDPEMIMQAARARRGAVAVWATRCPQGLPALARAQHIKLYRVEDGFIRSGGLGSGLLPPASIVMDGSGIYFDSRQPSDLETVLSTHVFDEVLISRARRLVAQLLKSGVTKYGTDARVPEIAAPKGKKIILVPGQVQDDLSIAQGGVTVAGNAGLLAAVRARHAEAFIIYRPHPDVVAGHRIGAIRAAQADQVISGGAMAALLDQVDEVHTMTSLAGFEALLRGKSVETYGQPFYAGWGLTTDHAPLPRRTRRLSVLELAAAALILYPLYLDPVSGALCSPETLVSRLAEPALWRPNLLMRARRWQGMVRSLGVRHAA